MSYDLHPPTNAFVFVCIVLASGCELARVFRKSTTLNTIITVHLVLAACFSMFAFITGLRASEMASGVFTVSDEVISSHYDSARLLLFFVIPCPALFYIATTAKNLKSGFVGLYRVCLAVCLGLAMYTGYLGGQLVFKHGAGVQGGVRSEVSN